MRFGKCPGSFERSDLSNWSRLWQELNFLTSKMRFMTWTRASPCVYPPSTPKKGSSSHTRPGGRHAETQEKQDIAPCNLRPEDLEGHGAWNRAPQSHSAATSSDHQANGRERDQPPLSFKSQRYIFPNIHHHQMPPSHGHDASTRCLYDYNKSLGPARRPSLRVRRQRYTATPSLPRNTRTDTPGGRLICPLPLMERNGSWSPCRKKATSTQLRQ